MPEKDYTLPNIEDIQKTAQSQTTNSESGSPSTTLVIKWHEINTKEIVIGVFVWLAAAIIFYFIKNFMSKMLVASFKKSPRSADMAAWSLFCILIFGAAMVILAVLDSARVASLPYLIPMCLAMLVSFITFVMGLLSKR